jgi:hypothetical protein
MFMVKTLISFQQVFECPCAQKSDEARQYIDAVASSNAHAIAILGEEFKSKQTKEFAVVVQPFGAGVRIPDSLNTTASSHMDRIIFIATGLLPSWTHRP